MSGFTDLFNQLGRAGAVGVRTGAAAAPVVNRRVQWILWTILGGLAAWPLVITGIAITGAWSGWLVAIAGYVVPVFLMLWAIIIYWWFVGPVLFVSAGRKFIGMVVFVAVGVMGIALYMSIVPVHNAVSLAFAAMLAMAILVTLVVAGRLTGPGRGLKMFLGIVFVAFVAITAAIPAGGFGPLVEKVKTAAAAASAQAAPVQTEGLLIVRKGTEEILHIPDDQEVLELPLVVGQDTVRMALPANATDAEIETRPTDKPYMMCFEGKGCFVSNPGEHWDADFDFDTTIFWFQGVEPGVTMVITPIGR